MSMSDQLERKVLRWTMYSVLLVVLLNFASSLVSHGKLMQKVDDLADRVSRIEQYLDQQSRPSRSK